MLESMQKYVKQLVLPVSARWFPVRPGRVEGLIAHSTAGDRADGTIGWWRTLIRQGNSPFLYDYLVDRTDTIWRIGTPGVDYKKHCGRSSWNGKWTVRSLNATTEGIAFANDNGADGDERDDELTDFQRAAGLWLFVARCRTHRIDPAVRVCSHGEVSGFRGKTDPLPRILDMNVFRTEIARYL